MRRRSPSEILKRGYTDKELEHLYALARLFLEIGSYSRAEIILKGLKEIAPEFIPAHLGLGYLSLMTGGAEEAVRAARLALEQDPHHVPAMLTLVIGALSMGELHTAGSALGDVADAIDDGHVLESELKMLYRSQLARYEVSLAEGR